MRACVLPAIDSAAALARLRAAERHAVDGSTAEEMAEGCALLDVIEDHRPVGAVALQVRGDVACITAAATRGRATYEALRQLERVLRTIGVRQLGLYTKRPGLVRSLARQGYAGRQVDNHVFMAKVL